MNFRIDAEPSEAEHAVLDRLFNALWREGFAARRSLWKGFAVLRLPGGGVAVARVAGRLALDRLRTEPPYAIRRNGRLEVVTTPEGLTEVIGGVAPDDRARLCEELSESTAHTAMFIEASRKRAGGGLLDTAPPPGVPHDAWLEGFIVRGHPLHPGSKMRRGFSADELRAWSSEMGGRVDVAFVAVRNDHLTVAALPRTPEAWESAVRVPHGYTPIPVHPWQLRHTLPRVFARERAEGVIIPLPDVLPACPLVSQRTVVPLGGGAHLKLPVAAQMTSAVRTVSAQSARNGPRLTALLEGLLEGNPHATLQGERWTGHFWDPGADDTDPEALERARHLSAIVRDAPRGDTLVPAALLIEECPVRREPVAMELVERHGGGPIAFFAEYAEVFARGVLPLLLGYGFAAEAHAQNCVVDFEGGRVRAFVLRDLGGVRIHLPWLRERLDLHPASVITADTVPELFAKAHHTWLQGHLAPLASALDAPENALWRAASAAFRRAWEAIDVPPERREMARALFFAPRIQVKALTLMRLRGKSHHYDFCEVDNPLA